MPLLCKDIPEHLAVSVIFDLKIKKNLVNILSALSYKKHKNYVPLMF